MRVYIAGIKSDTGQSSKTGQAYKSGNIGSKIEERIYKHCKVGIKYFQFLGGKRRMLLVMYRSGFFLLEQTSKTFWYE